VREALGDLVASGRVVDLILALVVVEALLLFALHRWRGRGVPLADFLPGALGGVCLLLALRAALTGAHWTAIVPWLLASFAAHLWDLKRRWHGPRGGAHTERVA
jgi:hypothetical protein